MTFKEKREFVKRIKELEKECPDIDVMKGYSQHGKTSTFKHCEHVCYICCDLAKKYHYKVDFDSLFRGSMLHDFYLYDWHEPSNEHRLHGYTHPDIARKTVKYYFNNVTPIEENMIRCHMWPLTLFHMPMCKEAFILAVVDKYCSTVETFKRK